MTLSTLPSLNSEHWTDLTPAPRFITEWPDPDNGVGSQIITVQKQLGSTTMPWQTLACHVVGQRLPDGRPRWPLVLISVPRQAGKTKNASAVMFHRALSRRQAKVWYTCDTGQKARTKWLELVDDVNLSPYRPPFVKVLKTNGSEALKIPRLGSQIRPHPPTEDSLHSEQSDLNIIDEAWSFDEPTAAALMQAIVPTQSTRPHRQTVIISTRGTAESVWFHTLIEQALAGDPGVFLLDYGIPADADPTDLDIVAAHHPAYGHTVDMAALETGLAQLGPAGFARGYGNRATGARRTMVPATVWATAQTTEIIPADVPASLGAAIDVDRSETAIAAAALVDGIPVVEILDVRPGTSWAVDRLVELADLVDSDPVIDEVGPSSTLYAALQRAKVTPQKVSVRELTTASAEIMDRLTHTAPDGSLDPQIRFRPDPALDLAMQVVDRRRLGDAWTWSRQGSAGSIAALEAATLAVHGLLTRKAPTRKPRII